MRNTLLAAAAAFVIGGATVGSLISYAQPAPPPGPGAGHGRTRTAPPGDGPMGWMHRWREHHRPIAPGTFALVYRQADRNLTPPDVQKIAEALPAVARQSHLEGGRCGSDVRWRDRVRAGDAGGFGDRSLHHGPA